MSAPSRTPGQLKVPELKEELKKRGITPKGLKKDLVEKLEEVLQKEAEERREAVIEKIEEALQKNAEDQKEALVEKLEVRKEAEEQREAVIEKIDAALPKDAEERKEASVEKLEEVIQKVAEEQSGNTSSHNLSQQVPVGLNSPLLGSSDSNSSVPGSNGVDSPLPVVGSTQGSSPHPSLADIRNEDYNSPPQVADTKSLLYVPHQQVAGRENAEVKGHDSDCVLQAGHESALEPEKMEYDSQKEEYMEHFDSARKSPLGLVHDSEGLLHDGKEGAADDTETRHTVYSVNESGVDVCRMETLGSAVCFQNPGLKDEVERNSFDKDETLILSHSGPSMVEKHSNTLSSDGKEPLELGDAHIQCQGLDPLLDRLGAEVKISSEKGEVFHTSDKIADQIHSKTVTEYQLELQAENGNSLTGYKDENLKVPETGLDFVDMTKSEVVTVSQEATRVEDKCKSVSTNPTSYDFKSEPRHNYQVSEASMVRQDMVECETPRETDKWEIKVQGNNSGKVSKLSGTDLNFEHTERSESNPVGTENMGPRYAESQFISMNSPTHGFEYKPKNDHNGEETDRLKQNKEENHSIVASTCESEETVDKENTGSFEKGFKSNETDSNLAEKQPTSGDFLEHEAVKIHHINSHYTSEVLKSEHTCNTEILEAAEHKQNLAEYNYPVVMNEIKAEDQEAKVNASTFQTGGVSILTTSNIKLEEMQQGEVVSSDQGHPEYQVGHVQQNSLDQPHHESEYEPVSKFHEREAKEIDQVIENHYQCRKISVQESEQENKVSLPGFENDKLLQSCATDSNLVEEGKQEIISTIEESMKCEYSLSESIVQNSPFHESDFNLGANAEVLEGNDQHTMKMREEEHEEQEDKINELIMEGEKTSQIVFPDEWKSEPEFSAHQSQVDLDSPREMLGDSETLKLGHTKMADVAPMDVDFEGQTGKKRIYECSKEDGEPRQEPAKRQRRWNSGKNLLEAGNTKPLTTDTLKDIIPRDAAEVSVESSSPHPVVSHPAAFASQCLLKAEKTSFSRPAPPPLKSDSTSNGEIQKPRIVPPPLRSPTSSLKVERFLRPFTINALKELLSETGRVRYFWIDQIKTHCYVTYSSAEEAVATRNALYNLKWPIVGGRFLIAEFVDHEEVMSHGEGQSTSLTTTNPVPPKNITQGLSPLAPPGSYAQALRSPPLPDSKAKQAMASKKDPEPEPAVYTLDDLFKKTRAKPHIYYLPLNEEQVATKLAVRSRDQQNRL